MQKIDLTVNDMHKPEILLAENDFFLAYKPPKMHSAPQRGAGSLRTFFDFCAEQFPETAEIPGRKTGEGGLLHRLDFDTNGILLFARTRAGMEFFLDQQKNGKIKKGYSALVLKSETTLPGFPKQQHQLVEDVETQSLPSFEKPFPLQSAFKAYGPGRKAVRPISDGVQYVTEFCGSRRLTDSGISALHLEITRGFRHQIRCHLAWLGMPILNDNLYGGSAFGSGFLALRANSLSFPDITSGRLRSFEIHPLKLENLTLDRCVIKV